MRRTLKLAIYAGTGLYDKLHEEVEDLIRRGKMKKKEGQLLLESVEERERSHHSELHHRVEQAVRKAIEKIPVIALRREVGELRERLDEMERRLEAVETGPTHPVHI